MLASRRRPPRRARAGACRGHAASALVVGAAAMLAGASCDSGRALRRAGGSPAAEFLAVAGDSTYWVTSGPEGVRVRSAPLFLTRWAGRLADVYVVDDGLRFEGAEFNTVRVYRRDLLSGDSALVLADDEVPRLAARFATAHPDARPLDDEDDAESDPVVVAEHAVGLVAVHGPYVTVDLRTTVDGADDAPGSGGRGDEGRGDDGTRDGTHRETLRRRVVDLRTGGTASLATLFGAGAPDALAAAGRRALAHALATLDTVDAPTADDSARVRARAALATLRFDPENFGLVSGDGGGPAVQFVARGRDTDGVVTLALPPVALAAALPGVREPGWWTTDVRPLSPAAAPDAARLLARVLGGAPTQVGQAGTAAEQLVRLDRPPADPALRRALRRAFNESALDDAVTTSVAWRRRR